METLRLKSAFLLLVASFWLWTPAAPAVAADGDLYLGTWTGTWVGDDGSAGNFQLNLQRGSDGKVTGSIAVGQEGGSDYTAKLKSAEFTGNNFSAAYEPPDGGSQINLKGTFTSQGGSGDWSLHAKDQPSSPATAAGTWKINKK